MIPDYLLPNPTVQEDQLADALNAKMTAAGFSANRIGYQLRYTQYSEKFLFLFQVVVDAKSEISAYFGIQPRSVTAEGTIIEHDFNTIDALGCELSINIVHWKNAPFWPIGKTEQENQGIADKIYTLVEQKAFPEMERYQRDPNPLDTIKPTDVRRKGALRKKFGGIDAWSTNKRVFWMLSIYHEKTAPTLAKQFAQLGLNECEAEPVSTGKITRTSPTREFFGIDDLRRIATL